MPPPTSDIDPSSADKRVHMYRRGENERLGREERGKASDSCRRRDRNVDSDVDVRRGRRISGRWVSRRRERLHRATVVTMISMVLSRTRQENIARASQLCCNLDLGAHHARKRNRAPLARSTTREGAANTG